MAHQANEVLDRLFLLNGKAALVTGASGGIGREVAVALAQAGAYIGLSGTNAVHLQETKQRVEATGGKCALLPADLSIVANCRELITEAQTTLGRLDILINNAGMNRRKPIVEFTEDDYETIMNVNLRSVFFLSQAAYPVMRAQGGGKIVNVGSLTTLVGIGNVAVYGMTKAAIGQLTKTMAVEWAKDNIQANCVAPGFIKTPLTAVGQWADPHISRWILDRVPARRPGTPDELVGTVLFLSSAASDFVTGQIIAVDGGFLAGGSWVKDDAETD